MLLALLWLILLSTPVLFGSSSTKCPPDINKITMYHVGIAKNKNVKRDNTAVGNSTILRAAENTLGDSSRDIAGCGHGKLACAAMVSLVLRRAGVATIHSDCTDDMYHQLSESDQFERVPVSSAKPGDIIISPSAEHHFGHVGIVGLHDAVYSNNSYSAKFDHNLTLSIWKQYFGTRLNLGVYIYRKV